jgi:putative transcription factor
VQLDVCADCAKFGKIIEQPRRLGAKEQRMQRQTLPKEEKTEMLVENYAEIVKKKREAMGMTQKDFANRVNEKEVTISKIETGTFAPPLPLARKLERFLSIKLVEEYKETAVESSRKRTEGFTLGDFVKVKR